MNKRFQFGKVFAVSLGHLFHDIFSAFLSPLIPLLVDKLGIAVSMAGLLDVVRNVPTVLNPVLAYYIEKFRVKNLVIFTPIVTAIAMSLLGLAPTYGVVVILALVAGISSTLFHIPSPVMVKRYAGEKTGTGMSYYMLGGELSRTLGPLVITGAVTLWGLEGTWRLIPFGLIASGVLYWRLSGHDGANVSVASAERPKALSALRELTPHLVFIGGFLLFFMALKVSATLFITAYLVHHGRSILVAGGLLSILQFAGAVGTLVAGHVSDYIGKRTTLLIAAVASPLLMGAFLFSGSGFQVVFLAALGFVLFAPGPVILALVQDAGSGSPSFANGLYMTVQFGARSVMVFLVGLGIDTIGFDTTYRISAALAFGTAVWILFFPVRRVFYSSEEARRMMP